MKEWNCTQSAVFFLSHEIRSLGCFHRFWSCVLILHLLLFGLDRYVEPLTFAVVKQVERSKTGNFFLSSYSVAFEGFGVITALKTLKWLVQKKKRNQIKSKEIKIFQIILPYFFHYLHQCHRMLSLDPVQIITNSSDHTFFLFAS